MFDAVIHQSRMRYFLHETETENEWGGREGGNGMEVLLLPISTGVRNWHLPMTLDGCQVSPVNIIKDCEPTSAWECSRV